MQTDIFGNEIVTTRQIEREHLAGILKSILSEITLHEMARVFTNETIEVLEYMSLLKGGKACQKTSLLFNPHRLDTRASKSKHSIFQALKIDSFYNGLARAMLFKQDKYREVLYQVLQLGINGVQYINEFPPYLARKLALDSGVGKKSKVLDPCAGWGGRMIGISTICDNYTGFEPYTKTNNGLKNLYGFIKKLSPDFDALIYNLPFEESSLVDDYYDFAVTSPPYYDTEIYTHEKTNSLNRYKSFDLWCERFYIPLIEKTMRAIRPGGHFVLNIGSRIYPLNKVLLSEFGSTYKIKKISSNMSGDAGLGKSGEGESFYLIRKQEG